MNSIFKVGEYKLKNKQDFSHICITKRTKNYIHLNIKIYHGYHYSIYDVNVRKKIFIDGNNNEYIKTIYYTWNTIFIPSKLVLDSESGFDILKLNSTELENITE